MIAQSYCCCESQVEAATAQLAELQERSEQSTAAPKAQQTSEAQPAGWSQPKAANSVQNAELKTVLSSKRDSAASQNGNSQLMTSQQVSDLSDQVAYAQQHRLGTDQDSDRKLEVIQGDLQKPSTTVAEHATKRHSEQHSSTAVAGIVHSRTAVKHSGLADDSSKHSDTVKDTKEAALLDTPVSKMQPSPMPPTAETLHLQEQLLVQKQLTEKLQGTVKKLTAELAQRPPATPSQEDLLQRVATTPLTYPTDNPAVNLSLSAVSSNVEDDDAAAEPTELLPKFQQADSMVPSVGTDRKIGQHKVSETRSATHSIHTQTDKAVTEPIPVDMVPAQAGIADTSQTSSPLQLSPPESLPSSPNAAGAQEDTMRVPGSSYKSVMHVNDSFDASDEEPVSASLSPPTMRSAVQGGTGMQDSPDASTVQQEASNSSQHPCSLCLYCRSVQACCLVIH